MLGAATCRARGRPLPMLPRRSRQQAQQRALRLRLRQAPHQMTFAGFAG